VLRDVGAVELAQQQAVGGAQLGPGLVVAIELRRAGLGVDHRDHPGRQDPRAHRRRHAIEAVEDRVGLGDAGGLEHDLVGCERATTSPMPSHRSLFRSTLQHTQPPASSSTSRAARDDQPGVDRDPAELVDQHRDAPAVGRGQQRLSVVVLPAPRKPVRIVNGTGAASAAVMGA
jgi:hypothetical protein